MILIFERGEWEGFKGEGKGGLSSKSSECDILFCFTIG